MSISACCIALGLSVGTSTFTGATGSVTPGQDLVFVPYRPTLYGIHASAGRTLRIEIGAQYGEPGLAIRGDPELAQGEDFLVVAENAFKVTALSGSVSVPLLRLRGGPVLRGGAGAFVEHWSSPDAEGRNLLGGLAGLSLEIGLTRAFDARIDAGLGLSGSPFRRSDLPDDFTPKTTLRRNLSVGVRVKL